LPGPHNTTTRQGDQRAITISATARPAFSMSVMPAMPVATAARSARAISAGVKSAFS